MSTVDVGFLPPTFRPGQESFFGGEPPLPSVFGYIVVLGFGVFFSLLTTGIVFLNTRFGKASAQTSEHFNTAGRMMKVGLIANNIVSTWTWAATLLQSSNVAWQYGVSGPFWYAAGASVQVLLFGVLAIKIKQVAPSCHTVGEIVNARWGNTVHKSFLFFCFCANIIVVAMLLLGGAATVEALTGVDYRLSSFLIPWGIILYTASGGLQATFLAGYVHTVIIYAVLVTMIFVVYIKTYSSDLIYDYLANTVSKTPDQCKAIWSDSNGVSFYETGKYACGPVPGNRDGSYLTMLSGDGLMFGVINIIGNFGTVFVDQSYWQTAIAARPTEAAKAYFIGGLCWFSIPFSLATSLGLASTAFMLPITSQEAGAGLVPPAVATELLGQTGGVLILVMLFMAIVSTGSTESIAVSSLVTYDIYREYFNPEASGEKLLQVSRIVIVVFGLVMGALAIVLAEIGLNLGWVYLFMGIIIGPAVFPLWNMMTWDQASGTGAMIASWLGLVLGFAAWVIAALSESGKVNVDTLGSNVAMLTGNIVSILSSGIIHYIYSSFVDPQNFDFSTLDSKIRLVEQDLRGLGDDEREPIALKKAEQWVKVRGYGATIILVIVWPVLSIPVGVFTRSYFAFWVLISIVWGFGAALVCFIIPLAESSEEICLVLNGMSKGLFGFELFSDDDDDYPVDPETNSKNLPSSAEIKNEDSSIDEVTEA